MLDFDLGAIFEDFDFDAIMAKLKEFFETIMNFFNDLFKKEEA